MSKLRRYWPLAIVFPVLIALALWKSQVLHIVDRVRSPDGRYTASVLEIKTEDIRDETKQVPAVSVQLAWPGGGSSNSLCSTYDGLYWSPDSTMYLLEMTPTNVHGLSLELSNLKTNSAAFLSVSITSCMTQTHLADYGFPLNERERPDIDLTFLQWAEDSSAIQFRYAFTDTSGYPRQGTFWFHLVWEDGFLECSDESITDLIEEM